MNKNHKKILLQTRVNLVKDLEANDVLNYLYQERILSENDVELVKAEKTRKARAEVLLDTIPRKGKRAFDEFVNSLKQQNGTKHLADMLLDLAQGGEGAGLLSKLFPLGLEWGSQRHSCDRSFAK